MVLFVIVITNCDTHKKNTTKLFFVKAAGCGLCVSTAV